MWSERLRGYFAVGLVCVAIAAAFIVIDSGDEDPKETAQVGAISTTTLLLTTTRPRSNDDQLCDLADEYRSSTADADPTVAGFSTEALARFYADAAELNLGEVTPEFDAAERHYARYKKIGSPFGYNTDEILRAGTENDRWIGLVTLPALGVDESRTYVLAVCNVDLPEAPFEDVEEIEDLLDEILDEQED
ncbi:MAG: hypothetical protein IH940_07395 [Acidobacteria bacterium]|nr:hypothetical protein [Acidobacteriota bacterium]